MRATLTKNLCSSSLIVQFSLWGLLWQNTWVWKTPTAAAHGYHSVQEEIILHLVVTIIVIILWWSWLWLLLWFSGDHWCDYQCDCFLVINIVIFWWSLYCDYIVFVIKISLWLYCLKEWLFKMIFVIRCPWVWWLSGMTIMVINDNEMMIRMIKMMNMTSSNECEKYLLKLPLPGGRLWWWWWWRWR